MATQPTVKEMQSAIMTIRRFARLDDYNLCPDHQKRMVEACADVLEVIVESRDWRPVYPDD